MQSVQANFSCKHCSSSIAITESRSLPQTQRCTNTYANRQGSERSSVSSSLTTSHADSADKIQDQFSMPAAMCLTIAVNLAVYAHKIILRSSEMIEQICLDKVIADRCSLLLASCASTVASEMLSCPCGSLVQTGVHVSAILKFYVMRDCIQRRLQQISTVKCPMPGQQACSRCTLYTQQQGHGTNLSCHDQTMGAGRVGHLKLSDFLQAFFEIAPCLVINEFCTAHLVCQVTPQLV